MTTPNPCVFRFCDVEVRESERRVTRAGVPLALEPKTYRVLVYFLRHPGHLVTKNELLDAVWGDTAVTESSLTRAIALLRRALEDDPRQPRFIETVSTAGYRLICAVQAEDELPTTAVATASDIEPQKNPPAAPKTRMFRSRFWVFAGIGAIALAGSLTVVQNLHRPFEHSTVTTPEVPLMAVPLTAYPGLSLQPTFSPDGNEVAFSWNGEKQDHYEIYRKLIGQGEPLRLNTGPLGGYSPAWSPDGQFIAYYRQSASGNTEVCVIPALGGPERRLAAVIPSWWAMNFPHSTLAWTRDGKWLIVPDWPGEGQNSGIFLISVESGEKRRLTSTKRFDEFPSPSPDGRTLAFVREFETGNQDIFLLSLSEGFEAQGEPERLTYENRLVESPVWTRDGKEILFSSGGWWGERSIRRIAVGERGTGTSYRPRATSFGEDATTLSISSTTGRLVYTRLSQIVNIYRVELSPTGNAIGTPQRVTATSRVNIQPNFSPDGKRLTFTSTRSGNQEIWLTDLDGLNPRQMTSVGGALTSDSSWSPDGKAIVFNSRWKGRSEIYVVNVDGGPPRALTNGQYDNYWPTWSRDGKWIYFMSNRDRSLGVYKIASGGGDPIQVFPHGTWGFPLESGDGKWIYMLGWEGRSGLWKVPINGGKGIHVMERPDLLNYAVADRGVFFLDGHWGENAPASIRFLDFASGKTKLVIKTGKPISMGLAVSPDQRWLLFTEVEYLGSDLMLVDNFR